MAIFHSYVTNYQRVLWLAHRCETAPCSKVVGPRRFGTASSPLLCFRRAVSSWCSKITCLSMYLYIYIYIYIYIYVVYTPMYIYIYSVCIYTYIYIYMYIYIYIYTWIQSCKLLVIFKRKIYDHRGTPVLRNVLEFWLEHGRLTEGWYVPGAKMMIMLAA